MMYGSQKKGANDRNIMDVAVMDPELLNSKWEKLDHVNICRLYLNAFYVSDLSDDRVTIDKGYIDGLKKRTTGNIKLPDIKKPTSAQWQVWKSFAFRNFLSPGVTINPLITTDITNNGEVQIKLTEIEKIKNVYGHEGTLREILAEFPAELQPMIGAVRIPEDGGLSLCHSIVEGDCLGASDGSLLQDFYEVRGGFGYVLSHKFTDEKKH